VRASRWSRGKEVKSGKRVPSDSLSVRVDIAQGRDVGMMRRWLMFATVLLVALAPLAAAPRPAGAQDEIKIAYVLHGLNTFTEVIKQGAEDAGKDLGVKVDVFGQAGFDIPTHQGYFESAIQAGYNGIVVVPNGGDAWNSLIQEALDAKILLASANVTALNSGLDLWVGQDEYSSGITLGNEIKKFLAGKGVTSGKLVVGMCAPGNQVLIDRYNGLKKALEGTQYTPTEAYDVKLDNTENYNTWDNLATANTDAVGMVGLCSLDIANLAQIKERNGTTWMVAGYDLDVPTLQAIQKGTADITLGQQPYLQGYLPVRALVEEIKTGKKITGWIECPTEVVTKENVDQYIKRESDKTAMYDYYKTYMAQHFADLQAVARPYDDLRHPGMAASPAAATPAS
jgi:simple sugar transport system substrate-binding protein